MTISIVNNILIHSLMKQKQLCQKLLFKLFNWFMSLCKRKLAIFFAEIDTWRFQNASIMWVFWQDQVG